MEVAVYLEECFLINIARVFRPLHQVQRQPQHVPVVLAHQFLESGAIARLGLGYQGPLIEVGQRGHRSESGAGAARSA